MQGRSHILTEDIPECVERFSLSLPSHLLYWATTRDLLLHLQRKNTVIKCCGAKYSSTYPTGWQTPFHATQKHVASPIIEADSWIFRCVIYMQDLLLLFKNQIVQCIKCNELKYLCHSQYLWEDHFCKYLGWTHPTHKIMSVDVCIH